MEHVTIQIRKDLYDQARIKLDGRGLSVEDFIRIALRGALQRNGFVPLRAEMPFGKYRGETLESIIRADPEYVRWMLSNSTSFSTDEAAIELLEMLSKPAASQAPVSERRRGRPRKNAPASGSGAGEPSIVGYGAGSSPSNGELH
jgi:uncharacterized protein (DUF3820 family)